MGIREDDVNYANTRCCFSIAYLFESQSFQADWDHLRWPVRCVLLFAIFLQFSLFLPFQGMNLFSVAFQAFQSHTVSLQQMIKTCSRKTKSLKHQQYYFLKSPYRGHPKIHSSQIHISSFLLSILYCNICSVLKNQ